MTDFAAVHRDRRIGTGGLSRAQLLYLEERGLVGHVARSDDRRVFSGQQVAVLETLARVREVGAQLDEAAGLAGEGHGGEARVPDERLAQLIDQAVAESERRARTVRELIEIQRRRHRPAR